MGWFGSKGVKMVRHSGDNNETKKQMRKLPGVSESGSGVGIREEEINPFVSSLIPGDVIHFVMGIETLSIDNIVDQNILDEWDGEGDLDGFEAIMEKATKKKGVKYDGSGLVGALNDRLLIVMNGGKDKFTFAYNELNGISSYGNDYSFGQHIKIDRKNKNKSKNLTGNIYFQKSYGIFSSRSPYSKSREIGWKGFNEWFPSHLKNLEERKEEEKKAKKEAEKEAKEAEREAKKAEKAEKEKAKLEAKEAEEEKARLEAEEEKRIKRKIASAQDKEEHLDYDGAIEIYEEIGDKKSAKRVRKLKTEEGKVKVDQTVVHGDYVDDRDTIVKDSVVNKSNISGGSSSKMQELKELKEMFDSGFISKEEMEDMKKEILGK